MTGCKRENLGCETLNNENKKNKKRKDKSNKTRIPKPNNQKIPISEDSPACPSTDDECSDEEAEARKSWEIGRELNLVAGNDDEVVNTSFNSEGVVGKE